MGLLSTIKGKMKRANTPKPDTQYVADTSTPGELTVNLVNFVYFDIQNSNYIFYIEYSHSYRTAQDKDIKNFCRVLSKLGIRYTHAMNEDWCRIYIAGSALDFCAYLYESKNNMFLESNITYSKIATFLLGFYQIATYQTVYITNGTDPLIYPYDELSDEYKLQLDRTHPIVVQQVELSDTIQYEDICPLISVFIYINKTDALYRTSAIIHTYTYNDFFAYLPYIQTNPNYSEYITSITSGIYNSNSEKLVYSDNHNNNIVSTMSEDDQSERFIEGLDEIV